MEFWQVEGPFSCCDNCDGSGQVIVYESCECCTSYVECVICDGTGHVEAGRGTFVQGWWCNSKGYPDRQRD